MPGPGRLRLDLSSTENLRRLISASRDQWRKKRYRKPQNAPAVMVTNRKSNRLARRFGLLVECSMTPMPVWPGHITQENENRPAAWLSAVQLAHSSTVTGRTVLLLDNLTARFPAVQ